MSELSVGILAQDLNAGYISFLSGRLVLAHAEAAALLPMEPGHPIPLGLVFRQDGSSIAYDAQYYLDLGASNADIRRHTERAWATGALITLADALDKEQYFDHAPELELVYHLRNAVAHGNRFTLTKPGLKRLVTYPAHNREALLSHSLFEIVPALHGSPALFEFMAPGDVLDLLSSVSLYLIRKGNGDTPVRQWLTS